MADLLERLKQKSHKSDIKELAEKKEANRIEEQKK